MITLTYDVTTVNLKDPLAPHWPEEPPRQRKTVSGGGVVRVAQVGDPDVVIQMQFRNVSDAQGTALLSFLKTTVNYSEKAFTYTDPFSTAYANMRYDSGIETWKKIRGGWQGSLVLRKDLGL